MVAGSEKVNQSVKKRTETETNLPKGSVFFPKQRIPPVGAGLLVKQLQCPTTKMSCFPSSAYPTPKCSFFSLLLPTSTQWCSVWKVGQHVQGGMPVVWGQETSHRSQEKELGRGGRTLGQTYPHLPWPPLSQTENPPASQSTRESAHCLQALGAHGVGAFPWYQETFSTKLSLDKGKHGRCAQIGYHQVLFSFLFIFLHTGKSSEGA